MSRIGWKRSEVEFLVENFDKMTTDELHNHLAGRSKKSINRKLEVLRDEGRIGHRTQETVRRAYYQRGRGPDLDDGSSSGIRRHGRISVEDYGFEEVD